MVCTYPYIWFIFAISAISFLLLCPLEPLIFATFQEQQCPLARRLDAPYRTRVGQDEVGARRKIGREEKAKNNQKQGKYANQS